MIFVVVLASSLMLTAAQLQIRSQQIASLPNLQPMRFASLTNSEDLMTHSAHSILNQDIRTPLSPGILGGVPVVASEAAQSILDQESMIVGYNFPKGLQSILRQQATTENHQPSVIDNRHSPQLFIPSTQQITPPTEFNPALQQQFRSTQSSTFPMLSIAAPHQASDNVIPVRATVSLQSLLIPQNPKPDSIRPFQLPATSQQVYYDISPNHPVPAPLPARYQAYTDEEIVYMRPPLFSSYQNHHKNVNEDDNRNYKNSVVMEEHQNRKNPENSNYIRSASVVSSAGEKEANSEGVSLTKNKIKKSRKRNSKSSTAVKIRNVQAPRDLKNKLEAQPRGSKNHHPDSYVQSSENSFVTSSNNPPLQYGSPYYGSKNAYNEHKQEAYASPSNSSAAVHKHIFVHAAPETYPQNAPRVRVLKPSNPEKHMQIIFVKSPTEASITETIVEMPPAEHPKTLVYILSKQLEEKNENVRVIKSPATKPPPPEIYFIRYGEKRETQGYPVPNIQRLNLSDDGVNPEAADNFPLPVAAANSYNPEMLSFLRQKRHRDYGLDVYAPLNSYSTTGQINQITQEEAELRTTSLDSFF